MRKHPLIWTLVFVAAICLLAAFLLLPLREPACQGRPLSAWVNDLTNSRTVFYGSGGRIYTIAGPRTNSSGEAIRQIGTNAIPCLLRGVRHHDNELLKRLQLFMWKNLKVRIPFPASSQINWKCAVGLDELRENAIPAWKELVSDPKVELIWRLDAVQHLGKYPDLARDSVPTLLKAMAETQDTNFRDAGVRALGGFYAPITLPIFLEFLRGTNTQMAVQAATVLSTLGSRAREAAPALLQCLSSASKDVRTAAAFALNSVEPEDIASLLYLLEHAPLSNRLGFCWMIGRRPEEAAKAIPVLLRCLDDPQPQIREAAAETLGKYGRQAVSAVPALQKLLDHPKKYVRIAATNALHQIQGEAP